MQAIMNWIGSYGPFSELTTDRDGAIRSHAFQLFAARLGFTVRPTSSYNKSNGNVEAEMKFINWYLAKNGGDQSDLSELSNKLAIALNSRCRFRCAGMFFNSYGLICGFYSRSIAERTAGVDLESIVGEFNFVDWIVNAAVAKGDFIKQNLGRRGVPLDAEVCHLVQTISLALGIQRSVQLGRAFGFQQKLFHVRSLALARPLPREQGLTRSCRGRNQE
jgi:hypothetical protein